VLKPEGIADGYRPLPDLQSGRIAKAQIGQHVGVHPLNSNHGDVRIRVATDILRVVHGLVQHCDLDLVRVRDYVIVGQNMSVLVENETRADCLLCPVAVISEGIDTVPKESSEKLVEKRIGRYRSRRNHIDLDNGIGGRFHDLYNWILITRIHVSEHRKVQRQHQQKADHQKLLHRIASKKRIQSLKKTTKPRELFGSARERLGPPSWERRTLVRHALGFWVCLSGTAGL